MRSIPSGRTNLFAALGLIKPRRKSRKNRRPVGRPGENSLSFESLEDRRVLAALTVNTNVDALAFGNSTLTLREAIAVVQAGTTAGFGLSASELAQINTSGGFASNTITFTSDLNNATITLARNTLGQLAFSAQAKSLTIDTTGRKLTIDADDPTPGVNSGTGIRVFDIIDTSNGASPPSVTLKGLTLTGGDVGQQGTVGREGGVIRSAGVLTLINCIVAGNFAEIGGGVFVEVAGGGATLRNVLTIEDCRIENNEAFTGGGVEVVSASSATLDTLAITRTEMRNNTARGGAGDGGALRSAVLTTLRNCTITGNSADRGGGAFVKFEGSGTTSQVALTIEDTIVENNESLNDGGGVTVISGPFLSGRKDSVVISRTTIRGNTTTFFGGGGLSATLHGAAMSISDSAIDDNHLVFGGRGGGLYALLDLDGELTISKSRITGNSSTISGGGAYVEAFDDAKFRVEASAISGNSTVDEGGGIAAIAHFNPFSPSSRRVAITLASSLIENNYVEERGGGVYFLAIEATQVRIEDCRITGNHTGDSVSPYITNGGGVYAYLIRNADSSAPFGRFTITNSTVDNNSAELKGGGMFVCIKHGGEFVGTNSTFSSNWTRNASLSEDKIGGGGMFIAHPNHPFELVNAELRNITVTKNRSKFGGGVGIADLNDMHVAIANSIISENFENDGTTPSNLRGRVDIENTRYNLIGSGSEVQTLDGELLPFTGPSPSVQSRPNIVSDAPLLSPLGAFGGLWPTHALLAGSPAIDAGLNSLATDPFANQALATDQRGAGFRRIVNVPGVRDPGDIVDIGAYEINPPKVIEVIVSSSVQGNVHGTHEFSKVVGSGEQLRTVPVGGANLVQVVFSEPVTVPANSVTLTPISFNTVGPFVASESLSADGRELTLQMSGAMVAAHYGLRISDVVQSNGLALDGEWWNPSRLFDASGNVFASAGISKFPSGDGVAGGNFAFVFSILPGDANRDNRVGAADIVLVINNWAPAATNRTWMMGDFTGEGATGAADQVIVYNNGNKNLQTLLLADCDGDGVVDVNDGNRIATNYGMTNPTFADGDVNGDGFVDGNDFVLWQLTSRVRWILV